MDAGDIGIAKGLTLRQCCELLGVDPSNWSKLERGITPAPKDPAIVPAWLQSEDLRIKFAEQVAPESGVHTQAIPTRFDREDLWPAP